MKVLREFKQCPDCGCGDRLMENIMKEEKNKGNVSEDASPCVRKEVFVNIDPKMPILAGGRLPAAQVSRDICLGCGREYNVMIQLGFAVLPQRAGEQIRFI